MNLEFQKKNFLQQYLLKQRELGKKQREYKQLLNVKLKNRDQNLIESSIQSNTQLLKSEKNDLKAQLWTAKGKLYERSDQRYLRNINCHIECQEYLSQDIQQLKIDINNMKREVSRVTRNIYDINREIVPDAMHQLHVARSRKKMQLLENQLEVGVRRECIFTAYNSDLRRELVNNIHFRRYFNESYSKMVDKLNSERKYINDLIEHVLNIFEHSIEISEKTENHKIETSKKDLMYADIVYKLKHDESINVDLVNFYDLKNHERPMADLQPKEYKRREKVRQQCTDKINEYEFVLDKIMEYTNSTEGIEEVIKKFKEQESIYYSYFNYANEMSYHMTLLNNSVNRLYDGIEVLKVSSDDRIMDQITQIERLEDNLRNRREYNNQLLALKNTHDERLNNLLDGIGELFSLTRADATTLFALLGDHGVVDLVNIRHFLKILEQRVSDITASIYITEREMSQRSGPATVEDVGFMCDERTPLKSIVLAQQCPECAEGEAINDVDDGGNAVVLDEEEFKKRLYEKIKQPEMQYRLHSISQCRLPRSRLLAAKR